MCKFFILLAGAGILFAISGKESFSSDLWPATEGQSSTSSAILDIEKTINPPLNGNILTRSVESIPSGAPDITAGSDNTQQEVPIARKDSAIIQFIPGVTKEQIDQYLKKNAMTPVETYPTIGALRVETDLGKFSDGSAEPPQSANEALQKYLDVTETLKRDPLVLNATPDLLLQAQNDDIASLDIETAQSLMSSTEGMDQEIVDWGVSDIGADRYWSDPATNDGAIFGVMDAGFGRHEDLTFVEIPTQSASNHGNHVAGIACARHNKKGVSGVLPNCFVRARTGNVFLTVTSGQPQFQLLTTFGFVLATLQEFVESNNEVKTFNVSLGYNWMKNFRINPDLPESDGWRSLVESQGVILVSMLEKAESRGKVIFSAAGNDSAGQRPPIGARYASPMNWAALTAREQGLATSGVVVEAHDKDNKRAAFSNTGGDISCPGVNILSSVAFDRNNAPSQSVYAVMSGTSMAAPYCAAGYQLFRMLRPAYSSREAVECIKKSSRQSDSNAPELSLPDALAACP